MKKILVRFSAALLIIMSLGVVTGASTVMAASHTKKCGDAVTAIIKCDASTDGGPVVGLLVEIINFLAVGVGVAVAGGIVWGGFVYSQANGNSTKTQEGITIIVNAVIGLMLFIFMYAIVNWLVPGGLF